MMRAACHCGAVRFELAEAPPWVLDCNCSLCRRYGTLWAYYHLPDQSKLLRTPEPNATSVYRWNERNIAFHFCKACGCLTHMEAVHREPFMIFGVNARMMVGLDPAQVQLRQLDNGHSGFFWTKSDEPMIPANHPPPASPNPDDWR